MAVDPDPGWVGQARVLERRLRGLLHPLLLEGIHHVGSTAVPGLPAKPIIDLMAGVRSLDDAAAIAAILTPDGWHFVLPELDGRSWRRFLVLVHNESRVAQLHLMEPATSRWREQLAFRDALRGDPALAADYGELKRDLALRFRDDREAYGYAKEAFVRGVLGTVADS